MDQRTVVVTGIGMLSALGLDRESVWQALVEGRCGVGELTLFDGSAYRSRQVAEVPAAAMDGRTPWEGRRLSRTDWFAVRAAREALEDSGLLESGVAPERVGVVLGAGTSDLFRNEEYFAGWVAGGARQAPLAKAFNHFTSTPVDVVAARFGLGGLRACPVSACSSSTIAIGYAADAIRAGQLDAALAGGSDALCRLTVSGFNALRLVDTEPCRPFAAGRAGMNLGEAAAVLVLEDLTRARRRGARVYAEVAGCGVTCEAHHPLSPEPEGRAVAALVRAALDAAGVSADEVDHINAHGTGTDQNDRAEARGFRSVFGDRMSRVPVTSIKSMVGHCLGAAGGIEAAALALTIARGVVPPTIHHDRTDPDCPIDVVANAARQCAGRCGMSTSLAFGGNDAALVMRRI